MVVEELVAGVDTETVAEVPASGPKQYGFANLGFLRSLAADIIMKSTVPVFVIPS